MYEFDGWSNLRVGPQQIIQIDQHVAIGPSHRTVGHTDSEFKLIYLDTNSTPDGKVKWAYTPTTKGHASCLLQRETSSYFFTGGAI